MSEEKIEEKENEEEKPELPEGCRSIYLQESTVKEFGLQSGATFVDVFPYKLVATATIKADCETKAISSDFYEFRADIDVYPENQILLVSDSDGKYGDDNFYIVLDVAVKIAILEEMEGAVRAKEAAEKKKAEEAAAAAYARANVVYEPKPFVSRPYDEGSRGTHAEVQRLTTTLVRPLRGCAVTRLRKTFGLKPAVFSDLNADNEKYRESRSKKNPEFDTLQCEREIGLQGPPPVANMMTQTSWWRPLNKASQCTPVSLDEDKRQKVVHDPQLGSFLQKSLPIVEKALQQNETVDIFRDIATGLEDEDASNVGKKDNKLTELRQFSDIVYSKNMSLSAVDWHPVQPGMLAVSPTQNIDMAERVMVWGRPRKSYILVWDFQDLIHPAVMLESPQEMFCFRFSKNQPNLVVAGCMNGQIAMWDLNRSISSVVRRNAARGERRSSTSISKISSVAGVASNVRSSMSNLRKRASLRMAAKSVDENNDDSAGGKVSPMVMSDLDTSHKRMVSDIVWLPPGAQMNSKGQKLAAKHASGKSHQLMTVSGDSVCLIWDIRYEAIAEGKLPHIFKPRVHGGAEKEGKDAAKVEWTPLFTLKFKSPGPEHYGELSVFRICSYGSLETHESASLAGCGTQSQFFAATEEGPIIFVDWDTLQSPMPRGSISGEKAVKDKNDGDAVEEDEWNPVQWIIPAKSEAENTPETVKSQPCVALQISPFFPTLLLTVDIWQFQLWDKDVHHGPVYCSPHSRAFLATGCWSPTRPGMILVARQDGVLDVWDLTDSSYVPVATFNLCPARVTSMEFLPPNSVSGKQCRGQQLAVGDTVGNLHVFDMPRSLSSPQSTELGLMRTFLEREMKKVSYVAERRAVFAEKYGVGIGGGDDNDDAGTVNQSVSEGGGAKKDDRSAKEEAEYTALERKFIEELELDEDDLPEHWRRAHEKTAVEQ